MKPALGAALLLVACAAPDVAPAPPPPPPPTVAERVFGGEETIAFLRSATAVEVVRLHLLPGEGLDEYEPGRAGRRLELPSVRRAPDPPVSLTPEQAALLAWVLTDPRTYQLEESRSARACLFLPGVLARFWRGDEPVDVAVCFACSDLVVRRAGRHHGRLTDFRGGRAALLAAVRLALPGDRELEALDRQRR